MLNTTVFEFPAIPGEVVSRSPFDFEAASDLPDVPALPETLIALELQLCEWPVNLGAVASVLLGDLGAVIQVLRQVGREHGDSQWRPDRIEDCICDLGLRACLAEASRGSLRRGDRLSEWTATSVHAREIARSCGVIAEEACASIRPCQAYLAGLLHELGTLPIALGWDHSELPANPDLCALRLAECWDFPQFLKEFFRDACRPGRESQWTRLIAEAHRLSGDRATRGSLTIFPVLLPA